MSPQGSSSTAVFYSLRSALIPEPQIVSCYLVVGDLKGNNYTTWKGAYSPFESIVRERGKNKKALAKKRRSRSVKNAERLYFIGVEAILGGAVD